MKTLMIDMDDVITKGRFDQFLEEFLDQEINENSSRVYFRQDLISGHEKEFQEKYQYEDLYKDTPLIDGCFEVLEYLNHKFDIYIVTSYIWKDNIINPEENLKNKFKYLQQMLPFISPNKYIFTQNKQIMNFDVRIDDRLIGLENADLKLLFNSWSNKYVSDKVLEQKNVKRVFNWYEIKEILDKYLNEVK